LGGASRLAISGAAVCVCNVRTFPKLMFFFAELPVSVPMLDVRSVVAHFFFCVKCIFGSNS
jgi:hypothetical protein